MKTSTKVISITSVMLVLLLVLGGFLFFRYGFVRAEGTDTGDLNYFCKEGVIFKTYEGKMVQTGLKKAATNGGVQNNEFKFSVVDEGIADSLMHCTGKTVTVHYQKYNATLPWRGSSVFVVDSIWSVK